MHIERVDFPDPYTRGNTYSRERLDWRVLRVRNPKDNCSPHQVVLRVAERFQFYRDDYTPNFALVSGELELSWVAEHISVPPQQKATWCASFGQTNFDPIASVSAPIPWNKGSIDLEYPSLKGCRLGTYFLDFIVQWLQLHADPQSQVTPLFIKAQNGDDTNVVRRNQLYTNFGFLWDCIEEGGLSCPLKVCDLLRRDSWKQNVEATTAFVPTYFETLDRARQAEMNVALLKKNLKWFNQTLDTCRRRLKIAFAAAVMVPLLLIWIVRAGS